VTRHLTTARQVASAACRPCAGGRGLIVAAILLSLPGQSLVVFGVEVVAVGVLTAAGLLLLDRRADRARTGQRITRILGAAAPNATTAALFLVAGLLLILGLNAGLYVLVAPILTAFLGGVASAWLFMTRLQEPERPRRRPS
jgi:hypothetical protein